MARSQQNLPGPLGGDDGAGARVGNHQGYCARGLSPEDREKVLRAAMARFGAALHDLPAAGPHGGELPGEAIFAMFIEALEGASGDWAVTAVDKDGPFVQGAFGFMRRAFVMEADHDDVWSRTLSHLDRAIRKRFRRGTLDFSRPLHALTWSILRNRVRDWRRSWRRLHSHYVSMHEEALEAVGRDLRNTETGKWWAGLSELRRKEIQAAIREAIARLSWVEYNVFCAFEQCYGAGAYKEKARKLASEAIGRELERREMDRILRRVLKQVRRELRSKGNDQF